MTPSAHHPRLEPYIYRATDVPSTLRLPYPTSSFDTQQNHSPHLTHFTNQSTWRPLRSERCPRLASELWLTPLFQRRQLCHRVRSGHCRGSFEGGQQERCKGQQRQHRNTVRIVALLPPVCSFMLTKTAFTVPRRLRTLWETRWTSPSTMPRARLTSKPPSTKCFSFTIPSLSNIFDASACIVPDFQLNRACTSPRFLFILVVYWAHYSVCTHSKMKRHWHRSIVSDEYSH